MIELILTDLIFPPNMFSAADFGFECLLIRGSNLLSTPAALCYHLVFPSSQDK